MKLLEWMLGRQFGTRGMRGTVAFNMKPVDGPWGGSSPFVSQLRDVLLRLGYRVRYDLDGEVDVIILVDPRRAANKPFGVPEIAAYRKANPAVRVIHRVNECDQRKNTDFMDRLLAEANVVADHTVFISEWLRDYHAAKWFDSGRPHSVIYNGADEGMFHPPRIPRHPGPVFRIVTHHWSGDVRKGYDVYEQVDAMMAEGRLSDFEFWIIGRPPVSIKWKVAKVFAPLSGHELAERLRECDIYLTASRWEPCGMHHVEGVQCGLPLVYHEDGGGIVEAGRKYGIGFRDDVATALAKMRSDYGVWRRRVMAGTPSGLAMCVDYARTIATLAGDR